MSLKITSFKEYQQQYQQSLSNPDEFWSDKAKNFHWFKPFTKISNCDFTQPHIEWFKDGVSSIAYNCLDRHIEAGKGEQIAIIHEPNDPKDEVTKLTYKELHAQVCQFANMLEAKGIKAQDRVCIYMPMIIQGAVAMLACARIGAIHNVVFAGFSAKSLADRIENSAAKMLITADILQRGEKKLELWEIAKEALSKCDTVENVILYRRSDPCVSPLHGNVRIVENHELSLQDLASEPEKSVPAISIWQDEIDKYPAQHNCAQLPSEHPLFILYTSGSTGKPKGVVHSHGGYMVYTAYSFQNVFQYNVGDIFFCTADIGWITGHSYLLYAPLLSGGTTLMFEGVPTYPDASRFWQIIDKHKVNIFYTAPTAIRALMQKGDEYVVNYSLQSLKTLGSVGEPINKEAWQWYYEKVGKKLSTIVDTWWQTETGGILISALSGITPSEPTYAGLPLPGVAPLLLDDEGKEIKEANKTGNLCFKQAWPSMLRGVWGDKKKFKETYFSQFPGYYFAGDGAFKNEDGLFRIIGRVDDVINVSGHRLGTAEIENVINMNENVSESAVIGYPHEIKGEGICAFVISKQLSSKIDNLENEIIKQINSEIGAIAKPDKIYIVTDLPKTRSGKIMRRVLKKIIAKEKDLGDVTTLMNPDIVEKIQALM